jgi:hypothetical protein
VATMRRHHRTHDMQRWGHVTAEGPFKMPNEGNAKPCQLAETERIVFVGSPKVVGSKGFTGNNIRCKAKAAA